MTTLILFLLLVSISGFSFHLLFGRSVKSVPYYLLAALGGSIVGFTLAALLNLRFMSVGGLPVLATLAGALLFLTLIRRIQVEG